MPRRRALVAGLGFLLPLAGSADASKSRRIPNMPTGWTWPPSAAMTALGQTCLDELDEAGVQYERTAPTKKVTTPIVVPGLVLGTIELQPTFRKPPFVMDCLLARALTRHSEAIRELGITALRFSTIHEYRTIRVGNRKSRILSRHSIGLAIDVYEVELDDGSILEIAKDYPHPKLRALEKLIGASETDFRTPLTPRNDPKSHDDHFHLEARMPL